MSIESEVIGQYISTLLEVTETMVGEYPSDYILEAVCSQLEIFLLMLEE